MDISLLVTGAMMLLKPLLEKAGEKAAETIGEKFGEKAFEKSFWDKVKGLFIKDQDPQIIREIENKTVATQHEVNLIEKRLYKEMNTNPLFVDEMRGMMNINLLNEVRVCDLLQSIQRLQDEIKRLEVQMERAGIAVSGDYINKIELQKEKLNYQINELYKILKIG